MECDDSFAAAGSYNRLHSTGLPWIRPEESPWRCSHGGDKGELLQSVVGPQQTHLINLTEFKWSEWMDFLPFCSCYQTTMEKVPDHILKPLWEDHPIDNELSQWWAMDSSEMCFLQKMWNNCSISIWLSWTRELLIIVFIIVINTELNTTEKGPTKELTFIISTSNSHSLAVFFFRGKSMEYIVCLGFFFN